MMRLRIAAELWDVSALGPLPIKQYDFVRVAALRTGRFTVGAPGFKRHPRVGDLGTIVEVYGGAYEVECCEPDTGNTIWLETMFSDELEHV